MRSLVVLSTLILGLALGAPASAADPCPVKGGDLDGVIAAMKGKSCAEASDLAERCALGASGDVPTTGAATAICEKDFAKHAGDKKLFASLSKRCVAKFEHQDGTMYRSATGFCVLGVARLLSQLNLPVDAP